MNVSRTVRILIAAMILMIGGLVHAQDSSRQGWQRSLIMDLTVTQTAYSDSWSGGEAGSFNWVGNINGWAERQLSPKFNFRSILKISFGQTFTQDAETKNWSKPAKSTDLIDWENLARFTLGGYVDPFAALRIETQFQDASVSRKKRSLSPFKLTESVGLAHEFYKKEKDQLLTRLGFAVRQTFTKTITDSLTFETVNRTATDGGLESVTDAAITISPNLKYTGKLTLYKAFFFSNKDDLAGTPAADDWKAVDINWENIINASITKIISVNLYAQLLYDKEISSKGRFKETLGLGFVFKLI